MSESSANKTSQYVDHDHDDLDDTMPMRTIEQMLEASEEELKAASRSSEDPDQMLLTALLSRLVELSESIDGRLGNIADLLAAQRPPSRSTNARKKASKKRSKTAAKRSDPLTGTAVAD